MKRVYTYAEQLQYSINITTQSMRICSPTRKEVGSYTYTYTLKNSSSTDEYYNPN
ncbi:hypothetical protein Hanom_Chr09g00782751 [Helianthus anomalus]